MDGQIFAQTLRERMPDTPIVLLTSGTMPSGEQVRVFDARLLKPYRQSQLFEAIARVTSPSEAIETVAIAAPAATRNQFILVADDNTFNLKVALTASVLEEDRERCREAGLVGFLPKPLRLDELSEALARYARQPGRESAAKIIAVDALVTPEDGQNDIESSPLLMDRSRLEQFRAFDNDERSMTREVVTLFASETPPHKWRWLSGLLTRSARH